MNYATGTGWPIPKVLTAETCHGCTISNASNPHLDMLRTIYIQHLTQEKDSISTFSSLRAVLF